MGYTPPWFNLTKVGTQQNLKPFGITGDKLSIYANNVDAYPILTLNGSGSIYLEINTGDTVYFREAGVTTFAFDHSAGDMRILSMIADHNIFLNPNGAGKVKFGTWTNDAVDHVTNGYIDILDNAGNARKLLTRA